ncbi:MAG: hypothetical protein IT559_04905, partial [Alphaproteobacteria bacterium]|nr:hypothetical protein [Alphaproteobacteria bacterium]
MNLPSLFSGVSTSLHFSPLLPALWLYILFALAVFILMTSFFYTRKSFFWRAACLAAFFFVLSGPALRVEKREAVPDIAALIIDESASQNFGQRTAQTNAAVQSIRSAINGFENIELRVAKGPKDGQLSSRTDLFQTLEDTLGDVPENRRAGAIFVTDGQVHDLPDLETLQNIYGPVHVFLTGEKDERDRRISVIEAPAFGIVGQNLGIKYRIMDSGAKAQEREDVRVTLKQAGQPTRSFFVKTGEEQHLEIPVTHAGQNIFELKVEDLSHEITTVNNRAVLDFQGVRDRLRVLLVSGRPHPGGRTWRDLLTSDPGVDLVHFTILREPDKIDSTPSSEMSLIAFPFRELFEVKLYDFDLIIFDRYRLNRILPDQYFENIARYVREGGAFLEVSGPDYASRDSIYNTALQSILPGVPTGEVLNGPFLPRFSAKGNIHPVTRGLTWGAPETETETIKTTGDAPQWGPWLRQIGLTLKSGDVLMTGNASRPLLILDRVGEGRAAQIASDQIWLWSRGYKGGGPHAELLRRLVHWLMKEPELD